MVKPRVAVVIPCYKVSRSILQVLAAIGKDVDSIYVVDDGCPENTGDLVIQNCVDPRVQVIHHQRNQGVGGATITGYYQAIAAGAEIIIKLDGDGQMDPAYIPALIAPILAGNADYTKGNRFFNLEDISQMPLIRVLGNAGLSFMSKFSSGYWDIFDPTNGYTAIHAKVAHFLPLDKLSQRFFFESDLLFRLNTVRAVVMDVPMPSSYGDEVSNLKISRAIFEFTIKHLKNLLKRIFYNYYLRDFNIASLELLFGMMLFLFGVVFGTHKWTLSVMSGVPVTSGTVMLAALPVIIGVQLLLSFLNYDIQNTPRNVLHTRLKFILKKRR